MEPDITFSQADTATNINNVMDWFATTIGAAGQELKNKHPDYLPVWKTRLETMFHSALSQVDALAEGTSSLERYKPNPVPQIMCSEDLPWPDIPRLLTEAISRGAESTGGFLVDLDPTVNGYQWEGFPDGQEPREIPFRESRISSSRNGAFPLDAPKLGVGKSEFEFADIQSWPREKVTMATIRRVFDRFEQKVHHATQGGKHFDGPPYAMNIDAATTGERSALGLKKESPLENLVSNLLPQTNIIYPGIHNPEAFVSTSEFGAPFGAHVEDFHLHALNYLVKGAPKAWIVIPAKEAEKFEKLMTQDCIRHAVKCSQFVRHEYLWPTRQMLEDEGIEYSLIYQQQHQAVLTLPRVYHYGFNLGANIAEAVNYMNVPLEETEYRPCRKGCGAPGHAFVTFDGLSLPPAAIESEGEQESNEPNEADPLASGSGAKKAGAGQGKPDTANGKRKRKPRPSADKPDPKRSRTSGTGNSAQQQNSSGSGPAAQQQGMTLRSRTHTNPTTASAGTQPPDAAQNGHGESSTQAQKQSKAIDLPFELLDRVSREIAGGKDLTTKMQLSIRSVARSIHDVGSVTALKTLQGAIRQYRDVSAARAQPGEYVGLGAEIMKQGPMSSGERLGILFRLEYASVYARLLWRLHLVKFVDEAPSSVPKEALNSKGKRGISKTTIENDALIDRVIQESGLEAHVVNRLQVNQLRNLGLRYKELIAIYGPAVLALMPLVRDQDSR